MRHPTQAEREALAKMIDECGMGEILLSLGSVARCRGQDDLGSALFAAAKLADEALAAEIIAQIVADEDKANGPRTRAHFWDLFQAELVKSITTDPDSYALRGNDTPETFAARTRAHMEPKGLRNCNLATPTFRRVAKALGVRRTRRDLVAAYEALPEGK